MDVVRSDSLLIESYIVSTSRKQNKANARLVAEINKSDSRELAAFGVPQIGGMS